MSYIMLTDPVKGMGGKALTAPTLLIEPEDFLNVLAYAQAATPAEINGYAMVRKLRATTFQVVPGSVFITEQTVAPGSAVVTPAGVRDANKRHQAAPDGVHLGLQWHSHGTGDAYHSDTDLRTCDSFGRGSVSEWRIWMVVNDRGSVAARLEQYRPIRMGLPMNVVMESPDHVLLETRAAREFAELVTVEQRPGQKPRAVSTTGTTSARGKTPDGAPCASLVATTSK